MRFKVDSNRVSNYQVFIRRAGYAMIYDRRRGVESFVRRLGDGHYPRLHLYIDDLGDNFVFNLHLDQKKASYAGFKMHNAEYDNEIVLEEINRLKSLLGVLSNDLQESTVDSSYKKTESNPIESKIEDNINIESMDKVFSGNLEEDINRMSFKKKKKFLFF